MTKDELREKAIEAVTNVHQSVADLANKNWLPNEKAQYRKGFRDGFDFGYEANAGQWVRIESEADLPKEAGDYLITFRWQDEGPNFYVAKSFFDRTWEEFEQSLSVIEITAWRELPEPYKEKV